MLSFKRGYVYHRFKTILKTFSKDDHG